MILILKEKSFHHKQSARRPELLKPSLLVFFLYMIYTGIMFNYNQFVVYFQYKTERDGVVETRVEQKITIQSDGDPIDHDRALAEAIQVIIRFKNIVHSFFIIVFAK